MKKYIFYFLFLLFSSIVYYYFLNDNINLEIKNDGIIDITYGIKNIEVELVNIDNMLQISIDDEIENLKKTPHIKTPSDVKSLYFSANAINNESKLNNFFEIAKNKEINSIMIDLKEVDGYTTFELDKSYFGGIIPVSNNRIKNISELIEKLHKNNIYIIARIAVFKDKRLAESRPDLSVKWISNGKTWEDYKGYKYTDQYSKDVWDYHAELGIAAYDLGFDEINYDYVRFPTDGYISKTYYPFANKIISKDEKWGKVKVIDMFSNYITTELRKYNSDIIISADVFGLVTDYTMFGIGQNLESFLLSFDFVGPMIYPSHYGEGYYGYKYPDNVPYQIINMALTNAKEKIEILNGEIIKSELNNIKLSLNESFSYSKTLLDNREISIKNIRPYLQGFSCTRCNNYTLYNRDKFRTAVSGVNDAGIDSWWVRSSGGNYRNVRYNNLKELKKDEIKSHLFLIPCFFL